MKCQRILRIDAYALAAACTLSVLACGSEQPAPGPAPAVPAPAVPAPAVPAQAAPAAAAPVAERVAAAPSDGAQDRVTLKHAEPVAPASAPAHEVRHTDEPSVAKIVEHVKSEPKKPGSAKHAVEQVRPEAVSPDPPQPAPASAVPPPPPPSAAAVPASKVVVPRTAHVHVEIPAGLQAWLDADTRMQPWVSVVMRVADRCYDQVRASNASAGGAIEVAVTMHKDARPDADILALPPQLSGIVTCGTGDLMRSGMPLFTGNEGNRYRVRIVFEP